MSLWVNCTASFIRRSRRRRIKSKRFQFPLEALLRKRKIEQDQALKELAVVLAAFNEQEAKRSEAFRLLDDEKSLFEKKFREEFHLDLFQMYDKYLERLESEAIDAEYRMQEMQPALEAERQKVMIARRNKRIIELLKESQKKLHDEEQKRLARRELFEINSGIVNREGAYGQDRPVEERKRPAPEPEPEAELPERRGDDLISEYFRRLGLDDPRKKN